MVRVNLSISNPTAKELKLDFNQAGRLTQPLNVSTVSVLRFTIPNAWNPIMEWRSGHTLSLGLNGYTFTTPITNINIGAGDNIYEVNAIVNNFNQAFIQCFNNLAILYATQTGLPLPTTEAPRLIYDSVTSVFSIIINHHYGPMGQPDHIEIYFGTSSFMIIKTLPFRETGNSNDNLRWCLNPTQTPENIYLTNYYRYTQESPSIMGYATPRLLLITTQMPVEGEIQSFNLVNGTISNSSNISTLNVIQSYVFPYESGTRDVYTNNDFTAISEPYRVSRITGSNIYNVQIGCYWQDTEGAIHQFTLPPYCMANVLLEFK